MSMLINTDGIVSILKTQLQPNRLWQKWFREIATQIHYVAAGLKTGFLWDLGPTIDVARLTDILQALQIVDARTKSLCVVEIESDLILLNICEYWQQKFDDIIYVNVTTQLSGPEIIDDRTYAVTIQPMFDNLREQMRPYKCDANTNHHNDRWSVKLEIHETFCIPTIFGVMIGYPIVYWYDSRRSTDNCLGFVPLSVYTAITIDGLLVVGSLSCPERLVSVRTTAAVAKWFQKMSTGQNLRLKTLSKSMETVNL